MPLPLSGIYAIVDAAEGDPLAQLAAVLAGGIRLVQYRAKDGVDRRILRAMHGEVRAARGLLIVNDDAGALADCDGVHLGQEDLAGHDPRALRALFPRKILGVSCPDAASARAAAAFRADYLGVGAMYATSSKADAGEPIGEEGIRAVVTSIDVPVAAIGGIDLGRIPAVRRTGAAMAAVITAISRASDPTLAARALVSAWERG